MNWAAERSVVVYGAALATVLAGAAVGITSVLGPALAVGACVALIIGFLAFYSLTFGIVVIASLIFFESIATVDNVTFIKAVGVVVAISWAARAIDRRSEMRLLAADHPALTGAVLLFVALGCASILWAPQPAIAATYAASLALVALLMFIVYSAIGDARDLRLVLWALVLGAFLTTAYGIVNGLSTRDRLIGAIANPNGLAAALVPAIILAAVLAVTSRRWSSRIIALVAAGTCIVGLLLTQSRGAVIGLAFGLLVATLLGGALRPHAAAFCLIVVAFSLVYVFVVSSPAERQRFEDITAGGSSGRSDVWQIALTVARERPLVGVGLDNFRGIETRYVARNFNVRQIKTVFKQPGVHNIYLQVLAELGIIGLLLWLGILGGVLAIGIRSIRRLAAIGDRPTELLGRGVLIAAVATLASNFFYNAFLDKMVWLLMGLLLSLAALSTRAVATEAHEHTRERTPGPVLVPRPEP